MQETTLPTIPTVEERIAENEWFLYYLASTCARYGADKYNVSADSLIDDLMQEGRRAIVKAHDNYDPAGGASFIGYAKFWVKKFMWNWLHTRARLVRIPRDKFFSAAIPTMSLDAEIADEESSTLHELVGKNDCSIEIRDLERIVEALLAELPENERFVLVRHFYQEDSYKAIADDMNRSLEGIRQIERRALRRLRKVCELRHIISPHQAN